MSEILDYMIGVLDQITTLNYVRTDQHEFVRTRQIATEAIKYLRDKKETLKEVSKEG